MDEEKKVPTTEIEVEHPFVLTHPDGKQTRFERGVHEVEGWVKDHWFVKGFLRNRQKAETTPAPVAPAVNPVTKPIDLTKK